MRTEEEIRERYGTFINTLKRMDVKKEQSEHKILVISAILREYDWVLDEEKEKTENKG